MGVWASRASLVNRVPLLKVLTRTFTTRAPEPVDLAWQAVSDTWRGEFIGAGTGQYCGKETGWCRQDHFFPNHVHLPWVHSDPLQKLLLVSLFQDFQQLGESAFRAKATQVGSIGGVLSRFCHGGARAKTARHESPDDVWILVDRHSLLTTEAGRADAPLFTLKELCTNLRDPKATTLRVQ